MPDDPTTRRLTRQQIINMGRSGEPWAFVPIAARVLAAHRDDEGLRFLLAANLARLGLRSLSLDQLSELSDDAQHHPDVVALADAARALPDDSVPIDTLIAQCQQNVDAINRDAVLIDEDLDAALARWCDRQASRRALRAADGTIVRCPIDEHEPIAWRGLCDARTQAEQFAREHLADLADPPPAFVLEGLDPPWLFMHLDSALMTSVAEAAPRLIVVQRNLNELFDGLSLADLTVPLARSRLVLMLGADAPHHYERWITKRLRDRIVGPYARTPSLASPCDPGLPSIMARLARDQLADQQRLADRVALAYADRDAAYWAGRFANARAGQAPPLRVLIPSCRHSTYVRHASADLACALQRLGMEARVLIEPDDATPLTRCAYLHELAEFDPDLIVLINYPRASKPSGIVPANIPYVCWVQDAMPHLFDAAVGRSQTELDFMVGQLFTELFDRYEYPTDRALSIPATADDAKFCPGPVAAPAGACTIACVTHQSEPPEQMHRRLRAEALAGACVGATLGDALDELFERVRAITTAAADQPHHKALARAIDEVTRSHSIRVDPDNATRLLRHYALPLADRFFRHEALAWAASIADRRGWTLALHGRGWDRHPTLARYARGELAHGDALRASYQAATVHLHISATSMTHQRVMECALSGGLPVCRFFRDALGLTRSRAQACAIANATPVGSDDSGVQYDWTSSCESLAYRALCQRLGITERDCLTVSPARRDALARRGHLLPIEQDPAWLLGDLAETTFRDEASLEALIDRARTRPAWRANTIDAIARRVRDRLTPAAIATRIIELVESSLAQSSQTESSAAPHQPPVAEQAA